MNLPAITSPHPATMAQPPQHGHPPDHHLSATTSGPVGPHAPAAAPPRRWRRENWLPFGAHDSTVPTVPTARTRAKRILDEWGLLDAADMPLLALSELLTNAIQATKHWQTPDAPVGVRMLAAPGWLAVEVWDRVQAPPVLREPAPDDERGRGLHTVNQISHTWGYYRRDDDWKVVYAVFAL